LKYVWIHRTPYFNLPIVMLLIGLASLVVNLIFYSSFSYQHYLFLGGILISFSSYYFLHNLIHPLGKKNVSKTLHGYSFSKYLLNTYLALGMFGGAIAIVLFLQRGVFGAGDLFFNLRYAKTVDRLTDYGASHFALFSLIASAMLLLGKKNKISILIFVTSLLPAFSGVERTGILYNIVFYMYFYLKIHGFNFKVIGTFSILFLLIAISLAFLTNKAFGAAGEFFLIPYFAYGLEAFSERLVGVKVGMPASEVFGIFGRISDIILERKISYHDLGDSGVFNVYTYIYQPYFLLGEAGFFILMSALGVFFLIINELIKKNIYFLFINASLIYSVIMIFYDWTFNLTTHLYIAIAALPLLVRFKNK
jgi:oligosaccharide repeat unit polymerase